jgi:hypothetical protein
MAFQMRTPARVGGRAMGKKDWRITISEAAEFIGAPDAELLISRAWRQGSVRLQGVRDRESQPVEIPPGDGGYIDFADSSIGAGALFTTYRHVTIAWSDVKRLAHLSAGERGREKISTAEAGSRGGKKGAKTKRANMKWISRALTIGRARYERCPTASYASVARAIAKDCQSADVTCPKVETLAAWVSKQRKPGGEFPE